MTFWKYNFIHHMAVYHVDENHILPSIPPSLRLKTHITREEEDRMGVEIALTLRYREENNIPNSDAVQQLDLTLPESPTTPVTPRGNRQHDSLLQPSSSPAPENTGAPHRGRTLQLRYFQQNSSLKHVNMHFLFYPQHQVRHHGSRVHQKS